MKKRNLTYSALALFLLILAKNPACAQASLSGLQQLEKNQQMQKAYALAKQMALRNAGLPDFDLLFATAALNTNHPGEAAFAFDRVLLIHPNNPQARFGLAQANFELKNHANAKKNFLTVLDQHPNPEVRLAAQGYLEKIKDIEKKALTKIIAFVRTEAGYDTNANAAAAASFLTLPTGGLLPILPSSRATPSWYNNIALGLGAYHKVDNSRTVYFNVSNFQRLNYAYAARPFNFGLGRAAIGLLVKKGVWSLNFPVEFQLFSYGRNIFRTSVSSGMEISRPLGNNLFGIFVQSQFLSYPKHTTRNGHLLFGAFDWSYRFSSIPLEFTTRLYAADGEALDPISDYLTNSYWGGLFLLRWNGFIKSRPYLSVNYQKSHFQGINPTFRTIRGDDFINFVVGLEWRLTRSWYFTPSYSYAKNFSNVPLNRTERNLYQVGLEYRV